MLEGFPVQDEAIAASLRTSYGVSAAKITFLPLGQDNDARAYRVDADDGQAYFLKLRQGTVDEVSIVIPRHLRDRGLERIIAPLPTITRAPWGEFDGYAVLLYPFIDGHDGWGTGLSLPQWAEFGQLLKAIHSTDLPADLTRLMPREAFVPFARWSGVVRDLLAGGIDREHESEIAREVAAFLRERREEIRRLLQRAEGLGRALRERQPTSVLCHADMHVGNLLIEPSGRLHIVDWDQPILAPKERDLMFMVGPGVGGFPLGSPEETAFFAGYGAADLDQVALAFYRYDWAVQDIGGFADRIFSPDDLGAETEREAARFLHGLFGPGGIVEAAYQTEGRLPAGL